jgi:diacylglycerol kinase family enzyme
VSKIAVIINDRSGSGRKQKAFYKAIQALGDSISIYKIDKKHSAEKLVQKALQDGHTTIVAAGGDGTVSVVAGAIVKLGSPAKFGVLPVGTLNHFARDIKMPLKIPEALDVIMKGKSTFVDIGKMNSRYFINNSSLGIYPFLVKERETIVRKGLGKWIGLAIAMLTTVKRHPFVTVEFHKGGKHFVRKTPFVFIGNNTYNIESGDLLGTRDRIDEAKLSVFVAHTVRRLGLALLAWHAIRGRLREQKDFDSIGLTKITITSRRRKIRVSCDGEIISVHTPIHYSLVPKALNVIIP